MRIENKTFNIFKIEYDWHEGEHEETLLGKNAEIEEFEKDILEAKNFAKSLIGKKVENGNYLGKGYSVECLPEYYEQIIWFLVENKGYIECNLNEDIVYSIEDSNNWADIKLIKSEKLIKESEI